MIGSKVIGGIQHKMEKDKIIKAKEIESIKLEHQRALKKWQDFRKYSAPLLTNYLKKNGKPLKIGSNGSFSVENYSDSNNMIGRAKFRL